MKVNDIEEKVMGWFKNETDLENGSFRSWEHCFGFFQKHKRKLNDQRDHAALHLGFYLASWGMYRPSARIFKYDYRIHFPVIDLLAKQCNSRLWEMEFGSEEYHEELVPSICDLIDSLKKAYNNKKFEPSPTLISKIILGTIGCLPARDEYFDIGFRSLETWNAKLNCKFVKDVFSFCCHNLGSLRDAQLKVKKEINKGYVTHYPLMKLVDMYFHKSGRDKKVKKKQKQVPRSMP